MKVVVGLGNPGSKYKNTRHNIGFLIIDHLAVKNGVSLKRRLCNAQVGAWTGGGEDILLAKPQSYMNRSGECVRELLDEAGASVGDLVVVHDDLDLPFGRIRIRPAGGAGGHRGVLSIMESTAGAPFQRVRVGIGRPPEGVDPTDFVLQPFGAEEVAQLDEILARAGAAVTTLLRDGIQRAMEQFNRSH